MLMVFYNKHALLHCIINTSVIFLAVQNNYLQGQICLSPILRSSSQKRLQSCANAVTFRPTQNMPVHDLVLAARKLHMRYLGHVLRLPPDRIVRHSLVALVKGGTYYPEGSLFSDCEVDYLHVLIGMTKCLISRNRLVVRKRIRSQWSISTIICIWTIAYEDYTRYSSVCVVYR